MPNDPVMLLSYINTQLRDNYESLDELSKALLVEKDTISEKLKSINYTYDKEKNKFV